ncbi:MAG TPA: PAS domain S-box protein, partial [Rubricoccaceae bacterium]
MANSHAQDRDLSPSPEAAPPGSSAHDERLSDGARLSALQQSRLLDTPPEPAFDRLTELAKRLLAVPIALVTLVDHDRQFFKSQQGLAEPWATARETPLSHSFCQYVVAEDAPFVVEDARTHPLVQDNLATRDLGVVAYLGVPVHSPDGQPLGSICAIDTEPRVWMDDDRAVLIHLAAIVESEIGLRAEVAAHMRSETQFRTLFEASPDAVLVLDPETESVLEANSAACALYGCTRDELSWASLQTLLHGPVKGTDVVAWLGGRGGTARYEAVQFRADGTPFDASVGASLVRIDDRPVVLAVTRDVSERNLIARTSAARADFRESLADALRSLSDPTEIKSVATQLLGVHLGASRVHYGEIDDEAFVVVDRDYTDGAVSLVGRFRKEDFNPALARAHDAGKSVVTPDVANAVELSHPEQAAYAAAGVAAQVCVPLIKGERLVAVLAVHQREPRDWTANEVALIEETAERVWTALGRAGAEAALRESEEQYRLLADTATDVILTIDASSTIRYVNRAALAVFGYAPAEIVGTPLSALMPVGLRPRHYAGVDRYIQTGERTLPWGQVEARGLRKDGAEIQIAISFGEYVAGGERLFTGIIRDTTVQKETQEALRESEERLRLVSHATNDAVWDWDMRTDRFVTNPAFGEIFGWREQAAAGF